MSRDVTAYIDQAALNFNFDYIKSLAPHSAVLAMIKSNGYGHGLVRVARALIKADAFGVACLEEALRLREVQMTIPIFVMSGFLDQKELLSYSKNGLTAVVHHSVQLDLLAHTKLAKPVQVWLKIDTGMNRLGFSVEQAAAAYQYLDSLAGIKKPIGLMTHLADADNINQTFSKAQLDAFYKVCTYLKGPQSIVNSAGILTLKEAHKEWVRPGIMLYGVSPFADKTGLALGLKPVMTLKAKLIATKHVKQSQPIGYGCTWRAPKDMPLGVVAIGYGDGYPRHAKTGTPTFICGKVCPLVGRVSMDLLTVDLSAAPEARVGDLVTLWGQELPVETIAAYADTIGYELLCGVTQRVKFICGAPND